MRGPEDSSRFQNRPDAPESIEEAESQLYRWLEEGCQKAKHTLFILGSSEYRDLTERILLDPDLNPDSEIEILSFEIPELPQSKNNIKAYSFMITMDGASYQAGAYAADMGFVTPLIWLAYENDALLIKAADGFEAGYKSVTGRIPERRYLSKDWHGYSMDKDAYMQMEEIDG